MDSAIHAYSMVSVPLYDTLGPDAVEYICNHAELSAVACSAAVLPILLSVMPKCPLIKFLVRPTAASFKHTRHGNFIQTHMSWQLHSSTHQPRQLHSNTHQSWQLIIIKVEDPNLDIWFSPMLDPFGHTTIPACFVSCVWTCGMPKAPSILLVVSVWQQQ